jgi:hypothetical protein
MHFFHNAPMLLARLLNTPTNQQCHDMTYGLPPSYHPYGLKLIIEVSLLPVTLILITKMNY